MDEGTHTQWCSPVCDRGSEAGNSFRFCDSILNFSTASHEDEDVYYHKRKLVRDPMSHRIIEKRRRDRMNNCLADLSRLIPADYLKKGRGRIEKTEIIEMAIKHMRHLQTVIATTRNNGEGEKNCPPRQPIVMEHYRLGYLECLSEAMHFLVEIQGFFAGDALCVQMIDHLHRHCDNILLGDTLNFPRQQSGGETQSSSSRSTGTGGSPPLGMSTSTGGHSDVTCSSENDEPAFRRNLSSSSGIASFSVKEESEAMAEVRGEAAQISQRSVDQGGSQLRDMLMGGSRSTVEEHHMYKFKNTIQQRYNESQLHDDDEPPVKKLKREEANGRLSFGHKALMKPATQTPPGIPIFALHANGAFYIPLTLDQHALSPYLSALTEKPPHKAALHPVTISVNFQNQKG